MLTIVVDVCRWKTEYLVTIYSMLAGKSSKGSGGGGGSYNYFYY
jgi:hypothetical protein